MNSFMSSIKSAATSAATGGDDKKTNTDQPSNTEQASNSDLMSNAKLVSEAAQCAASGQTDKIDKPKVAGAAADLLESAETYGKFDETQGVGQYLKQADDYLHQYEKSGTGETAAPPPAVKEEGAPAPVKEEAAPAPVKEEAAPAPVEKKKEEQGSGFGAEDAFKAAGSFFK